MKRIFFSQMAICAFAVFTAACSGDEWKDGQVGSKQITMSASDFIFDANSRTSIEVSDGGGVFAWAADDTVGVFPNEGRQVDFPMIQGAGTKCASFDGGGWALKPSSKYMAYYPMRGEFYLDKREIPVDFRGQKQVGNASAAHLGRFDFMAAVASTPANGNVNFDFLHLGCLVELNLVMPVRGDVNGISLSADKALFTAEGTVDLTADVPCITPVVSSDQFKLEVEGVSAAEGETVRAYVMLAPAALSNQSVMVKVMINGVVYDGMFQTQSLEAGKAYRFTVALDTKKPAGNSYHVATAGSLPWLVGEDNKFNLSTLKVTGELNGTDIRFIREMAGSDVWGNPTNGKLAELDLYGASIVEGGERYYTHKGDFQLVNFTTNLNEVGVYMFYKCTPLTKVVLPKEVLTVGAFAFKGCTALEEVVLPKGLSAIGEEAFFHCQALKEVSIPGGVSTISRYAFCGCRDMHSLELAEGITVIEDGAFRNCIGLTSVAIPESVVTLSGFLDCTGLKEVSIGSKVRNIDSFAFSGCKGLSHIDLPDGLLSIGSNAFSDCTGLSSVKIPSTVTHLSGFNGCAFTSIDIPEG